MKKILVIDDNPVNLRLISVILTLDFLDYHVFLSQSGIEGIEIAKKELPDTILLDILMPGMDGFEVCHILKSNESTRHIPILLVSAVGEMSYRIKGLNAGADAFISKPIDRAELNAQVNVMLRIKFAEDILRNRNENLEILIKKQTAEFDSIEYRYQKVSEYALEYFWEIDQNGRFTYVSPVVVRILGYSPDEITGKKSLFDFCSFNENTKSKELLGSIFAQRENFSGNEVLCSHKNGNKIWLTISGFPFFDGNNSFAGYIGVNHDITRRKMAEEANKEQLEKINEYQKKLKNLYFELTIAEEKERRKIAEYLHDGLGQTISIASIKLSSIARGELSPAVKKTIEESAELLRNAINESRTLVYDLSPPILYELGLIAAIKWKLDQIEKKFSVITDFRFEENSITLETDIKILIFRMICELLNNAIKHAHADLITVEIVNNSQNIVISVIDNGKGFDLSRGITLSELSGFGLFIINERLDALQGSMQIDSEPSKGSKITIIVPI
jgi:PAS domain S-box-containing protein